MKHLPQGDSISINQRKDIAGSPSSKNNHEDNNGERMIPLINTGSPILTQEDKGKSIITEATGCNLKCQHLYSKENGNLGSRLNMTKMNESSYEAQRSGIWSKVEPNITGNKHKLSETAVLSTDQQSLLVIPQLNQEYLFDVPIEFVNNQGVFKRQEGQSKRRKVVPKRNKNKKGNCYIETTLRDSTVEGTTEDAKEISDEDICHALWQCPKVKNIWKQLGFTKTIPQQISQANDVLWWLHDHLPKEDFFKFIGLSWLNLLTVPATKQITAWQPPPNGVYMINTVASLIFGSPGCGISAVIRDSKGTLVVAATSFLPGCMSVLLAKATTILHGINLARRWSMSNVQVGSDSQTIIKAVSTEATNHTDWGKLQVAGARLKKIEPNQCDKWIG
ncbi:hypothetical protein G4B88_001786 [Cannabis sativa]|uniref:RNase H type-1 domain-containing protein n=1 Tax=Cannabis sativa TaxID=3483 RepID=A0A7J6I1Z3_CANSA|nr:hypothetical protein G4B88_001786 [Cannabis sativa]